METALIILGVIGTALLLLVLYGISIYNQLIELKNRFVNAFSQIDVQLQRRYDLIPNLVETAKGYMKYEQETLTKIIEERNIAKSAATVSAAQPADSDAMKKLISAESTLSASMGRFFALAENYPDLKANQTMQQLMEELTSTENKVSFARQAFNDAVMIYNTYRTQFPSNIIAGLFGFTFATHFEISTPQAKEAVKVSFT
ncbi:MAG: LemA family protein [Proteobacteria bacterium]|nr:LemA family protein [Pseudomonadota bacterium]